MTAPFLYNYKMQLGNGGKKMIIRAKTVGYQECRSGNCQQKCTTDIRCYQDCGGSCNQECNSGKSCEQYCTIDGNCDQTCSSNKCLQRCGQGRNCKMTCGATLQCEQVCCRTFSFKKISYFEDQWKFMRTGKIGRWIVEMRDEVL